MRAAPNTRAERAAEAARLRAQGLKLREIGERLGVGVSMAGDLLTDPTGEKVRKRKSRYEHPCESCGKTINQNGLARFSPLCIDCFNQQLGDDACDYIVEKMQEWARRYGAPPTATDWNPNQAKKIGRLDKAERWRAGEWPWTASVQHNFGSWANGVEAAGFARPLIAYGHGRYTGDDPKVRAEAVRLYADGLSAAQVAERLGCDRQSVLVWTGRDGLTRSLSDAQKLRRAA